MNSFGLVPGAGLEPARVSPGDFKSPAFTISPPGLVEIMNHPSRVSQLGVESSPVDAVWDWADRRYTHLTSRPLLSSLPAFFGGLLAASHPLAALVALLSIPLCRRNLVLPLFLFIIGVARIWLPTSDRVLPPGDYELTGRVISTPTLSRTAQTFLVDIGSQKLLVFAPTSHVVFAGDYVELLGTVRPMVAYSDNNQAFFANYWKRRGVSGSMSLRWGGGMQVLEPGGGLDSIGSGWRTRTWRQLRSQLPTNQAAIALGIVAGQQGLVSETTVENMRRAGTLHMLATSGYNVLLVVIAITWLLSLLPIHRVLQTLIAIGLLAVYVSAVGDKPPIIRAAIMCSVVLFAPLLGKAPDLLSALALSAVLSALIEPATVYDAGFHLSFLVLLTLLLYGHRWFEKVTDLCASIQRRSVRLPLIHVSWVVVGTVICQIGAAPALAAHFGSLSLVAPISNLLTWVAVPIIYVGVFLSQLLDLLSSELSNWSSTLITGPSAAWIDTSNSWLGVPSFASLDFEPVPGWVAAVAYGILVFGSKPYRRKMGHVEIS